MDAQATEQGVKSVAAEVAVSESRRYVMVKRATNENEANAMLMSGWEFISATTVVVPARHPTDNATVLTVYVMGLPARPARPGMGEVHASGDR